MADWLKYKQFFVGQGWSAARCFKSAFMDDIVETCEQITPLARFLNSAFV
jgi:hypothetical protein